MIRGLALLLLCGLAAAFEPVRSGFQFVDQDCEWTVSRELVAASVLNLRHLVGYGAICLIALWTFGLRHLVAVALGTFVFSMVLEFQQSFFATGQCRARDLIPNALTILVCAAASWLVARGRLRHSA